MHSAGTVDGPGGLSVWSEYHDGFFETNVTTGIYFTRKDGAGNWVRTRIHSESGYFYISASRTGNVIGVTRVSGTGNAYINSVRAGHVSVFPVTMSGGLPSLGARRFVATIGTHSISGDGRFVIGHEVAHYNMLGGSSGSNVIRQFNIEDLDNISEAAPLTSDLPANARLHGGLTEDASGRIIGAYFTSHWRNPAFIYAIDRE